MFKLQELFYSIISAREDPYQDGTRQGPIYNFLAPALTVSRTARSIKATNS